MLFKVFDETSLGANLAGDVYHIIGVAFLKGNDATSGIIAVTSDDPERLSVCTIHMQSDHFYCDIVFPNAGTWRLSAKYERGSGSSGRQFASATTTLAVRQLPPQPTETIIGPGSSYYQQTATGEYVVTVGILVSVTQSFSLQLISPGAGSVTVVDASGEPICSAAIPANDTATLLFCTSQVLANPPVEPLMANYSGTSAGINDGRGSAYEASSGVLTIGPY
jgi:hypothetical protein